MHFASRFLIFPTAVALLSIRTSIPAYACAPPPSVETKASASDPNVGPGICWEEDVADFGTFDRAKTQSHVFTFSNNGSEPLIIQKVFTDCGCTTVDYPKHPVLPDSVGTVTVSYRSVGKSKGYFMRLVRVKTNASAKPSRLYIKGKAV